MPISINGTTLDYLNYAQSRLGEASEFTVNYLKNGTNHAITGLSSARNATGMFTTYVSDGIHQGLNSTVHFAHNIPSAIANSPAYLKAISILATGSTYALQGTAIALTRGAIAGGVILGTDSLINLVQGKTKNTQNEWIKLGAAALIATFGSLAIADQRSLEATALKIITWGAGAGYVYLLGNALTAETQPAPKVFVKISELKKLTPEQWKAISEAIAKKAQLNASEKPTDFVTPQTSVQSETSVTLQKSAKPANSVVSEQTESTFANGQAKAIV